MNRYGWKFVRGRPIPDSTWKKIIKLAQDGVRLCDIIKLSTVSNRCVRAILRRYIYICILHIA